MLLNSLLTCKVPLGSHQGAGRGIFTTRCRLKVLRIRFVGPLNCCYKLLVNSIQHQLGVPNQAKKVKCTEGFKMRKHFRVVAIAVSPRKGKIITNFTK